MRDAPTPSYHFGSMPQSFAGLVTAAACAGAVLTFVVPLLSWSVVRRRLWTLAEEDEYTGRDRTLNWGLIQSHRNYDLARGTVMDAHNAIRRAVRRHVRVTTAVALATGAIFAAALAAAFGLAFAPEDSMDHYWPVVVAMPAGFIFAYVLTVAACVGATFQAVDAVAAMALQISACPAVDLTPVLLGAERISSHASISTASAHLGVVISAATGAIGLAAWLHNSDAATGSSENLLTPHALLSLAAVTAAGQHVASAVFACSSISLHHAVDDAIDNADRGGRHAMAHGLIAGSVSGTAFSVPAAVATVAFDALVAFGVCWGDATWLTLAVPVATLAAAVIIAIAVAFVVPHFAACGGDVANSDTIPRRSHVTLWTATALSVAAGYGLSTLIDSSLTMFGFMAVGAGVTLVTVETAQLLARGPLVRWVCRASIHSSTSAALASVDSITLVPALAVVTAAIGIAPAYAQAEDGLRALAGIGLGAVFPALALAANHGVGSLMSALGSVAKLVPFTTEQQAGVDIIRPPRDQASTASAVASTTAGLFVTTVLLLAAGGALHGVHWGCVAAGALFDSLTHCVSSIAAVGAQARMAPREEFGYAMASIVPRTTLGRVATPTDRAPHAMMEVFLANVWWCAALAPVAVTLAIVAVVVVGFSAGTPYIVSAVAGYGLVAQAGAIRAALTAGTMRSLHSSGERGKLGTIDDPLISLTADTIHSRKVMKQAVIATMCASTAIVTAVAFLPHFKTTTQSQT